MIEDKSIFTYIIPAEILAKIPTHFWAAFAGELVGVFKPDIFVKNEDGELPLNYVSGTTGWTVAFKMACQKTDQMWLYEYYDKLQWYESDRFDGQIEDILKYRFLEKDESSEKYYMWLRSR